MDATRSRTAGRSRVGRALCLAAAWLVLIWVFGGCGTNGLEPPSGSETGKADSPDEPAQQRNEADSMQHVATDSRRRDLAAELSDAPDAEALPEPAAGLSPYSDWLSGSPTGPSGWTGSGQVPREEALDRPSPPPGRRPIFPVPTRVAPGFPGFE